MATIQKRLKIAGILLQQQENILALSNRPHSVEFLKTLN